MNSRRVFYWAGPLIILWRQGLLTVYHQAQQCWQTRVFKGGDLERFWVLVVAVFIGILALVSFATHLAFFFKHKQPKEPFINILPHIILCGILFGTGVVLDSSQLVDQLRALRIDFLGHLMFYLSLIWFLAVLLRSLLTPAAYRGSK